MFIAMMKHRYLTMPFALMLVLWALQAAATSVRPVSLPRMAASAETIFQGKAISNEVRRDPTSGQVVTLTTFEVIEVIKGDPGTTYTIKQIGGELPGAKVRQVIHGVPRFAIGRDYVVFLPKASRLGFSSPIGLSQGKFDIRELNGETVVSNGRPVEALMKITPQQDLPKALANGKTDGEPTLRALPDHPASARLQDFMQTVRTIVNE